MNVVIISFFLWIPEVLLFTWPCISQRGFFFSIKLSWPHLQFFPLYTDSVFIMKQSNTIKHVALMRFKEQLVVLSHTPPSEKAASWPDEAHSQIVPVTKMGVESMENSWRSLWNESTMNIQVMNKADYLRSGNKAWVWNQTAVNVSGWVRTKLSRKKKRLGSRYKLKCNEIRRMKCDSGDRNLAPKSKDFRHCGPLSPIWSDRDLNLEGFEFFSLVIRVWVQLHTPSNWTSPGKGPEFGFTSAQIGKEWRQWRRHQC